MSKKKTNPDIHAIFTVKPLKGTSTGVIKCVGHISHNEEFADEPLVCNKSLEGDDSKYIHNISESFYIRFYRCNLKDSFMMTTKTLPVIYASILYKNELTCGLLFNIFIDFTIETETKSEKELINTTLEGKYKMRIKLSDNDTPKIVDLDMYDTDAYMIETMISIIETDKMKSIINKLMEKRRESRMEYVGQQNDYEIPKPKYNFTKLVQGYKSTGKILD